MLRSKILQRISKTFYELFGLTEIPVGKFKATPEYCNTNSKT